MSEPRTAPELISGIAAIFGLRARQIGIIARHNGLRYSAALMGSFEVGVEANVYDLDQGDGQGLLIRRQAWFPLSELAFLPVDLGFRIEGEADTLAGGEVRRIERFRPDTEVEVPERREHHVTGAATGRVATLARVATVMQRIDFHRAKPVGVEGSEIARFYLASLGLVANQLMRADYDEEGAIAALVDPEHTGFLDADTFQIAPKDYLSDRGSAMQLAMLLASPDLRRMWRDLASNVRAAHIAGRPALLDIPPPDGMGDLFARTMAYRLKIPLGSWDALKIIRIEADHRPPPFRNLLIHVPFEPSEARGEQDDRAGEEAEQEREREKTRRRRELAQTLTLRRDEQPSRGYLKIGALGQSFTSAFPKFRKVNVRQRGRAKRTFVAAAAKSEPLLIAEVSTLERGGSAKVANLVVRSPASEVPNPPPAPPGLVNLDASGPVEPLTLVQVPLETLSYPLRLFCVASRRLAADGWLVSEEGEYPLFELLPAWGRFAMLRRGQPRRAALTTIASEDHEVCAIELERRAPYEKIATGLFSRRDGQPFAIEDAAYILRDAVRRADRDGEDRGPAGTWPPDGSYVDVSCATLIHAPNRRTPATLSDALVRRAPGLLRR